MAEEVIFAAEVEIRLAETDLIAGRRAFVVEVAPILH